MDALHAELTRLHDPTKAIGYLNYTDGRSDVRFRKFLADVFRFYEQHQVKEPWAKLGTWLAHTANDLQQSGTAAYKDVTQAQRAITLSTGPVLDAYRLHHADLLAHQSDAVLYSAFFLARCFEATLTEIARGTNDGQLPTAVLGWLNDFVGYRPIALLEQRPQTDFYPHEKVCAVPLYFQNVGVAPGRYADVVQLGLELLLKTDPQLLEEACFLPECLEELAIDPRATDHIHPVNKRPNVLFGEWDPHKIDSRGYYTRFVVRQGTLDALVQWCTVVGPNGSHTLQPDRLYESAAVLAGTVLMGAGISGTGPTYYDSTMTLSKLVQKIARFRDRFYQLLLQQVPGNHGDDLRAEALRLKQPFGGVRQALNQTIAAERARQLQERRLAILFAAMGYPQAARQRCAMIPAPASRMTAEIRLRQTMANYAVRRNALTDVPRYLEEAEDILRRGIDCGAMIDPWNILGFQGLFPTFADRGDTVRDPRAEELIHTMGRQFDTYAHGLAAASAAGDHATMQTLKSNLFKLAHWWDRFATTTVTDVPKVHGVESAKAADHVARALALWKTEGSSDPAFWRKHLDGFRTPTAFGQVIEALIIHRDHRAAMALLMTWLSLAETIPLQDAVASFYRSVFRWMQATLADLNEQPAERTKLVLRFFELLEVNGEELQVLPKLSEHSTPSGASADAEDDADEDDDPFRSAYEGVTYKDSTDDGNDDALAADGIEATQQSFPLEVIFDDAFQRLKFLNTLARLRRQSARPDVLTRDLPTLPAMVAEWIRTTREQFAELTSLAYAVQNYTIPEPIGSIEALSEYDRQRNIKTQFLESIVQTIIELIAASRVLSALIPRLAELPGGEASLGSTSGLSAWEAIATRLERTIAAGERLAVRKELLQFIKLFRHEPLLVCPLSEGGAPAQVIRALVAQQMMESLLARLPHLGLLRETFHLTKLARQMERNDMPSGKRVSSFDSLFRTALAHTIDAVLLAARDWGDDAHEDGPLAEALRVIGESYEKLWREHSQTLRLSSLEVVNDTREWKDLKEFIHQYGADLFTVRFLSTANVRGILSSGAGEWLDRQAIQNDQEPRPKLFDAWEHNQVNKSRVVRNVETIFTSLLEHYDEYRDYNTTTTQSDYGENLYILLDFLRLKVAYDRYAWRLRPLVLIHDRLCKRGYDRLAIKWREFISKRTGDLARELLNDLAGREQEHGIKLRTIRDRLEERFIQPLQVDQAVARLPRAVAATRDGQAEDNPAFQGLLRAIQPLAEQPVGVGLDVPSWLRRLEDEYRKSTQLVEDIADDEQNLMTIDDYPMPAVSLLNFDDFKEQIREWDMPLAE
jgi:hypothetical protein